MPITEKIAANTPQTKRRRKNPKRLYLHMFFDLFIFFRSVLFIRSSSLLLYCYSLFKFWQKWNSFRIHENLNLFMFSTAFSRLLFVCLLFFYRLPLHQNNQPQIRVRYTHDTTVQFSTRFSDILCNVYISSISICDTLRHEMARKWNVYTNSTNPGYNNKRRRKKGNAHQINEILVLLPIFLFVRLSAKKNYNKDLTIFIHFWLLKIYFAFAPLSHFSKPEFVFSFYIWNFFRLLAHTFQIVYLNIYIFRLFAFFPFSVLFAF